MTGARRSPGMDLAATLLLWGLWAASALPLLVLFTEFRCRELAECGAEWWH